MRPFRDVRATLSTLSTRCRAAAPGIAAALGITAALGIAAAGCAKPTLSEEGWFTCSAAAPDCPEGYECRAGRCLPTGTSVDSGVDAPAADAPAADAPAADAPAADAPVADAPVADALQPDAKVPDAPVPDQVQPDTVAPDLTPWPDIMPAKCTSTTCSGHGTCSDTTGTAVCTCDTGYAPPNCAKCASGYLLYAANSTCIPSPCVPDPCGAIGGTAGTCLPSSGGKLTVGPGLKDDNPYDLYGCTCTGGPSPGTVNISQVKLNGTTSNGTAHPGLKYGYSLQYKASPPSTCKNCKLQLVLGYAASHHHNDAHFCREIDVSQACITGVLEGKIGAPRKLGTYDFRVGTYFLSDCAAAMDSFTNGTAGAKHGSLKVSEVKCYSELAYAKTFLVNGSSTPATVSKGASISISADIASAASTSCPGCVITAYGALSDGAGGHIGVICYAVAKTYCPSTAVTTATKTITAPAVAGMYRLSLSTLAEYPTACSTYLYKSAANSYGPERTIGLIKVQ
jgi:hypothetical protein